MPPADASSAFAHATVPPHLGGGAAARVGPDSLTRLLFGVMVGLAALHVAVTYLRDGLGYDHAKGLVPMFDFNLEGNAPTWFSSALLLGAGIVAAMIALRSARHRGPWLAVAGVAAFMSLDESAQVHELVTAALRSTLAVGPGFSLTVVALVSLIPALVGGALFYRFMRTLPRATASGLLAAGAIYVAGAIGIDTIASAVAFGGGGPALELTLNTAEELLEMSGVIVAIHVLLSHLAMLPPATGPTAPADPIAG
jgi:hypothetical protein